MSVTGNPTALRVGASGMLDGRRYTVRGRVVMSVMLDGETYYWNEFNLVDAAGDEMILVYEETEEDAEWKLFKRVEPLPPFSASAAATVRVGDDLELGDRHGRVTMVDESRVVFIEGAAPDGIYQGSVANCINADVGERMIVISWTGEEVEYYEGVVTSALRIQDAFDLPKSAVSDRRRFSSVGNYGDYSGFNVVVIILMVIGGLWFVVDTISDDDGNDYVPSPSANRTVSPLHLPNETTGWLNGRRFRIRGHAFVEISRLGDTFDEHEYALSTAEDGRALLVKALQGQRSDWYLLEPKITPAGFGPFDAAQLRQGAAGVIGQPSMRVAQLYRSRIFRSDGDDFKMLWTSGIQYGFLATDGSNSIVARWDENGVRLWTVKIVRDEEVRGAFGPDQ